METLGSQALLERFADKKELEANKERILQLEKAIKLLEANKPSNEKPAVEISDNLKKELHYFLQKEKKEKMKGRNKYKVIGGWTLKRSGFKVKKTWINTTDERKKLGIAQTKEFDAVELEKNGKVMTVVKTQGYYHSW